MSMYTPENSEAWRRLRPKIRIAKTETGEVVAVVDHASSQGIATGRNEAAALHALRRKLFGATKKGEERPWLELCKPCNRRAVELGDRQYTEGVPLCRTCAKAVDAYNKAIRDYWRRKARNRRKAERRRRRRR